MRLLTKQYTQAPRHRNYAANE